MERLERRVRTRTTTAAAVPVALFLALAGLGCGGKSNSGSPVGPSAQATATPVPQTLLKDGPLGPQWLGQILVLAPVPAGVSDGAIAMADSNTGDSSAWYVSFTSATMPGAVLQFQTKNLVAENVANFYANGHIQFDILLGGAYLPATSLISVSYGTLTATPCVNAAFANAGLSQTQFTHVSVPFTGYLLSCNDTSGVNEFSIVETVSGGSSNPGIQFYLDNVQWTAN